jgi:hypothetical protein
MSEKSTTDDARSAGPSPLRLRVGVLLILLWVLPFWLLATPIAHALGGGSTSPTVAEVTTVIVVIQTILGLLGFVVAGTAVKTLIKGAKMRRAVVLIWSVLLHGEIRDQGNAGDGPDGVPPVAGA